MILQRLYFLRDTADLGVGWGGAKGGPGWGWVGLGVVGLRVVGLEWGRMRGNVGWDEV